MSEPPSNDFAEIRARHAANATRVIPGPSAGMVHPRDEQDGYDPALHDSTNGGTPRPPGADGIQFGPPEDMFGPGFSFFTGNGGAAAVFTVEKGRAYKRHKNLSAEADADAERYLKSDSVFEQNYMQYMVSLENRDHLRAQAAANVKLYKIPTTVKETANDYARVMITSPSIVNYRATDLAEQVLDVMRGLFIANLPPKHETGQCTILRAVINKTLIDMRSSVKLMILAAIAAKENKPDIALLTKQCIGTCKQRPTAALYMRIAFLRKTFIEYLRDSKVSVEKSQKDFWLAIDKKIAEVYEELPDPVMRHDYFQNILTKDRKAYPVLAGSLGIVMAKDVDDWQTRIDERAGNLLMNDGEESAEGEGAASG